MYPRGGCLADGVNVIITYKGGNNRCAWTPENATADGVKKLAGEAIGDGCWGGKLWYTLKYD